MAQAVERAGWQLEDVELINAHGTSTPLNDKMEAMAIRRLFGDLADRILVNSTKSMIGHALGAAGAVESIAAIQSIIEDVIHPTINVENLDPECPLNVVTKTIEGRHVRRLLVNSFGFGGHNGVLALEEYRA
jgi:3-oxoacyl-[acyl-carrier-protein] synthase II